MRVIVYPHDLGIGGSQLNAIELAAAVRDRGHDVLVFGRSGPLRARIDELGLPFVEAPPQGKRPSLPTARALAELSKQRSIDVIHGYEWPPILDGVLAAARRRSPAVVGTVMSMSVPPFIPHSVPLAVGTAEMRDYEEAAGRLRLHLLEPPVDLEFNDPQSVDGVAEFRQQHGIDETRLNIVSVGRLSRELKLEGILTAIDVVGELAATHAVRLVLVGDGPARDEVDCVADAVNRRCGSGTVIQTGQMDDPRPAYAVADISLGMGGSALRALAYGKPLVVQGEKGFWQTMTAASVEQFLWTGWYGIGEGSAVGAARLRSELESLLSDPHLRTELGLFGQQLVNTRFSLTRAAAIQDQIYREAIAHPCPRPRRDEATALFRYSSYYLRKRIQRLRGTTTEDDFNSRPVTAIRKEAMS
ncbi:glycosyltransferase [Dietzia maris]|uniref:glycosyltransferase n=1 Tax=Dietzia maris TaxID=37915 RepID=UPI0037CB5A9D